MDCSVSSYWSSELGMIDSFLNDECDFMDFLDDGKSPTLGEDQFLACLSPEENTQLHSPTMNIPKNSSTTNLSAMELSTTINGANNLNPSPYSSPMILTFGNPTLLEINPNHSNLSNDHQDDAVSEVLTSQGSFLNLEEAVVTTKTPQKPKKSGGRVRPASQTYDHIMAERKRRELLSQRFVALSAIVPGLKKMDKTSVLGDAIDYLKYLQERVKALEEQAAKQTTKPAVMVKRSRVMLEDEGSSDETGGGGGGGGSDEESPLPEIEAKVCNKNILLRVHCEKHKGILVKLLSQVENLNLSVVSTSVAPFGTVSLDITVIALMDAEFRMTMQELITSLQFALRESAQAED